VLSLFLCQNCFLEGIAAGSDDSAFHEARKKATIQ